MTGMARLLDPLFTATLRACLKLVPDRPSCWLGSCQLDAAIDATSYIYHIHSLMLHLQNK